MAERGVTVDEVTRTLQEYDTDVPAKQGRRNRYKQVAGHRIRVTFDLLAPDAYYIWTVTKDEV